MVILSARNRALVNLLPFWNINFIISNIAVTNAVVDDGDALASGDGEGDAADLDVSSLICTELSKQALCVKSRLTLVAKQLSCCFMRMLINNNNNANFIERPN